MLAEQSNKNKQPAEFIHSANDALKRGRFSDAAAIMGRAIREVPDHPDLLPLAIRTLIYVGEHREANRLLDHYLQLSAGDDCHLGLCAELYALVQRQVEAVQIYRSLAVNGHRDARYNLGVNLLATGELAEAEQVLEDLVSEDPADAQAQLILSGLRRVTVDNNHIGRLQETLRNQRLPAMERLKLHYAMGKEFEDIGEFQQAFLHFQAGADGRRAMLKYRVESDQQTLALIAEHHRNVGPSNADPERGREAVFIFGLPRSGTTLVDRILSSHSRCDSFGEITDLPMSLMVMAGRSLPKEQLVAETARWAPEAIADHYLGRLANFDSSAGKHIDKTPLNFLYAGLIARAMPGASMIWMERHPLDACFAMYKTLFKMGYPFSYSFEDLAAYYIAYDRLKRHWQEVLGDRVRLQSYEKLVQEFDPEARALVNTAGMEWEASCGEFHKNRSAVATASSAQVRQPLYKRAVAHWRNYEEQLAPLAEALRAGGIEVD
ncbi:tetratricopeptide repeat-containing sulfotransferase family protein [Microbulbifer guangxiensis]|uniref:tetratricopeptide repeat-containing sulfotransferase family protein n=1 Tax=Microbulbifer guangxiensis TaxID=2904249 RepID=UPI001F1B833A|nr:sulfotransferase [Microbulbifer guangxiensis]